MACFYRKNSEESLHQKLVPHDPAWNRIFKLLVCANPWWIAPIFPKGNRSKPMQNNWTVTIRDPILATWDSNELLPRSFCHCCHTPRSPARSPKHVAIHVAGYPKSPSCSCGTSDHRPCDCRNFFRKICMSNSHIWQSSNSSSRSNYLNISVISFQKNIKGQQTPRPPTPINIYKQPKLGGLWWPFAVQKPTPWASPRGNKTSNSVTADHASKQQNLNSQDASGSSIGRSWAKKKRLVEPTMPGMPENVQAQLERKWSVKLLKS